MATSQFDLQTIDAGKYQIAAWTHITDAAAPVHIYIEGDGAAFSRRGTPTSDPTPREWTVRNLAARDTSPNVAYIARPCQFISSPACGPREWTDGRFSADIITAMSDAIKIIAQNRPVILIGYSGGAMISGLVVARTPEINIKKWITIAGVLNHSEWTEYFGDTPLWRSLNMNELPRVHQLHYVAARDKTVPVSLSRKWTGGENLIILPGRGHNDFHDVVLNFD